MLNVLHKKVKEVYRVCVGEVDSNISTLHMLANIESRMQDIMDGLETLPPDNIDTVRTQREKEKRLKYVSFLTALCGHTPTSNRKALWLRLHRKPNSGIFPTLIVLLTNHLFCQ